jgi:GNAT-family acetyltransferase (TIGR03103 family)
MPSPERNGSAAEREVLDVERSPSLANWKPPPVEAKRLPSNVSVDCGWGRLLFGHTYQSAEALAEDLWQEAPGKRDVALYLRDPHVLLGLAPQSLFLDPSHTFRLPLERAPRAARARRGFTVRPVTDRRDTEEMRRLFLAVHMVPVSPDFVWERRLRDRICYAVAEDDQTGDILGTVTGVDHVASFGDPEGGSSLWTLAVDPQARHPGIGQALVVYLAALFRRRGRRFMDLSVMADNDAAIGLYEKLGFERVPVFCVKNKQNPINEPLFAPSVGREGLNPYAAIIADEAVRRGILVDVVDAEEGYFRLTSGGRSILCRESLSELTSAVAMSRCQNKRVTLRVWRKAGLPVPDQVDAGSPEENRAFLEKHRRVVVKPVDSEQGHGVAVDIRTAEGLERSIAAASRYGQVAIEQWMDGRDLRVIVIGGEVVAAAVRRPPSVVGDGIHTVEQLIAKQSRRRASATGGESSIPVDEETRRALQAVELDLDVVLDQGREVAVRKTANLHTGGTIHDVTAQLHPDLAVAAVEAARLLDMPVVGLDLLVPDPASSEYVLIEANERPGLANHEPQPTAERFVDLLFPGSAPGDERLGSAPR